MSRSSLVLVLTLGAATIPIGCNSSPKSHSPDTETEPAAENVSIRSSGNVRLRVLSAEAKDALAVITATNERTGTAAWQRLKATEEYKRLDEREKSFHRAITDTAFHEWLASDSVSGSGDALARTLDTWMAADITGAAQRAAAYLPDGTPIHASLYFMIKPHPNTFVYDTDNSPTIFVSVDPTVDAAQFENEIAHELHHIGYAAACRTPAAGGPESPMDTVIQWMGAFGEGWAMLAAAGSPNVNPHWESDSADRARWDRDYAHAGEGMQQLSRFFESILERRLTNPDSVRARAMSFFGIQGPWYTVGYLMARTIEVRSGRGSLISVICSPRELLLSYQRAARDANREGAQLPLWPERLVKQLKGP